MIRRSVASALVAAALLVPATVAAAATGSGSGSDARGDVPAYGDVLRLSATYKSGGALKARFSLASYADAAAHRVVAGAYFATFRGGRCDTRKGALISLETNTKVAQTGLLPTDGSSPMPAEVSVAGDTVTLSARKPRFARKRFNCVVVASLVATGPTTSKILDKATIRLKRSRGSSSRAPI